MRKEFLLLALPIIILACNFLFPPARPQGTFQTPSTEKYFISRIHTADGDLMMQLASEAAKAKTMGLSPFIEFDASWCPSCIVVDKSIKAGDASTLQAFAGVYLIRADVDEWGWGDGRNFDFNAIPIYYQLDVSGNPTGAVIDGGAWGEDIPENFGPVLNEFFHTR
jgi:hypothetical protein